MTKSEAAEYLGISARSLERYTAQKRLSPALRKGKTRPVLDYEESDLEQLKAELEAAFATPGQAEAASAEAAPEETSPNTDTPSTALATLAKKPTGMVARPRQTSSGDIVGLGEFSPAQLQVLAGLAQAISDRRPRDLGPVLLLTLDECATVTGLSRATLRAAVTSGELAGRKIGRSIRVRREELERFVRETC